VYRYLAEIIGTNEGPKAHGISYNSN